MAQTAHKRDEFDRENLIYEAWYRGRLSYKLRPEQRRLKKLLYEAPVDLAVFNISRRFGKTTTCVTFAIENAIRKKQHIRYATAYLTDLEGFVLPIFEQVLEDCPIELRPKYMASKKEWRFRNGSVVKLIGLDKNPNGLRGNAIDILIIDESAFVRNLKTLYMSVIVPATMKRRFKLIFPSTPPESPEHFWAKDLIPRAKAKNAYVHLTIDDISDLPKAEKDRLLWEVGGPHSTTARREFYGEIIADEERAAVTTFSQALHVQAYEPTLVYWQAFGDAGGVQDKTVILKGAFCHKLKKIVVRSELVFEHKTPSPVIIQTIRDTFPGCPLTLDAPGQTLIDYSSMGLQAALPQKDQFDAGLQLLNASFYKHEIIIHPDCKFLIRSLEGALLNRQRSDYERSPELGHADAVAALVYLIRCIDRREYFPEIARLDPAKHHVPEYVPPVEAELLKLSSFGGFA